MKSCFPVIFVVFLYAFMPVIRSCNAPSGGKTGPDESIMTAGKPAIDSSRVLETLDLYRAPRYESVQKAVSGSPEEVYKLVLWGQKLGVIPPGIQRLKYLHSLDVAYNELAELPEELSQLHYLQGFYANGNMLTEFPKQILLLPVLDRVDLSENRITEIPGEIIRMDQLRKLDMGENKLTDLPDQLFELPNLEILTLDHNALSRVSPYISSLKSLRKLDISNNSLKEIPPEITRLAGTLTDLEIQGNNIPMEKIRELVDAMPSTNIRF
jgi:Leucine-rich repeat (LRR) protein